MVPAVTEIDQPHDVAGLPSPDRSTQLLEGVHRLLAHAHEDIAVAQPGPLGRASGQDVPDPYCGPVQGFGVSLCVGILTSMYTAVSVSRGIATLIYGRRRKLAGISI